MFNNHRLGKTILKTKLISSEMSFHSRVCFTNAYVTTRTRNNDGVFNLFLVEKSTRRENSCLNIYMWVWFQQNWILGKDITRKCWILSLLSMNMRELLIYIFNWKKSVAEVYRFLVWWGYFKRKVGSVQIHGIGRINVGGFMPNASRTCT